MKVDKAVCTDTMTDAQNAISYENLLSTLLQRKILAIKRDCEAKKEEKQRRKQQTCLGSLIFGKHHEQSDADGRALTATEDKKDDDGGGGGVSVAKERCSPGDVTVNVEDDDDDDEGGDVGAGSSSISGGHSDKAMVADTDQMYSSNPSISQQATATDANNSHLKDDDKQASVSSSVYSESIPADAVAINLSHINETDSDWMRRAEDENRDRHSVGRNECDDNNTMLQTIGTATHTDSTDESVHIASSCSSKQLAESTSDSHEMRTNSIENVPVHTSTKCDTNGSGGGGSTAQIERDIESLSPPATIKSSPATPTTPTTPTTPATVTGTSSKSSSIISQIEVSDECNPKQMHRASQKSSGSDTISLATGLNNKRTTSSALSSLATTADIPPLPLHDHEQQQRQQQRQQISHLLEAKSISAQCSPIFAQRMPTFTGKLICCMGVGVGSMYKLSLSLSLPLSISLQFVVASGALLKDTKGKKYTHTRCAFE